VDEVLLSAVDRMSQRRLDTYRGRLAEAADLPSIVAVAREVLAEDVQNGAMTVLSQMVAGAHGRAEFSRRLADSFDPWIDLVDEAVQRVVAGTGLEAVLPSRDLALAMTGTFVGVELLSQLNPDSGHVAALLATLDTTAGLFQSLLALLGAAPPGTPPQARPSEEPAGHLRGSSSSESPEPSGMTPPAPKRNQRPGGGAPAPQRGASGA